MINKNELLGWFVKCSLWCDMSHLEFETGIKFLPYSEQIPLDLSAKVPIIPLDFSVKAPVIPLDFFEITL